MGSPRSCSAVRSCRPCNRPAWAARGRDAGLWFHHIMLVDFIPVSGVFIGDDTHRSLMLVGFLLAERQGGPGGKKAGRC